MKNAMISFGIALICLTGCQIASPSKASLNEPVPACDSAREYCPSALQVRVDESFSEIAIETQKSSVKQKLTEIRVENCWEWGECQWKDANGVRHYFWGNSPTDQWVVVKTVEADDFKGRSISALGIGYARKQSEVMANVRKFLGRDDIECDTKQVSGNVGPVECNYTLHPGWFQIGFSLDGNLLSIRFDGYHFT